MDGALGTKAVSESSNVRLPTVKASSSTSGDEREADAVSCLRLSYSDLVNVSVCTHLFDFSSSTADQVDLLLRSLLASRRLGEEGQLLSRHVSLNR